MSRRKLTAGLRLPARRETFTTLAAGALISAICWYFGVDVWHAILLGCAVTVTAVAAAAGTSAPDARDLSWRPGKRLRDDGSRNDVHSLSSSLRAGWGLVGPTAERRLYALARRRLALEGLDLHNPDHRPQIERRIGEAAYRILKRHPGRRLRLRKLMHCLDALDAIDSTHYRSPQRRPPRWEPRSLPSSLRRPSDR